MRKSEMTKTQLSLRQKLLEFITENEWESSDSDWFDEDLWSQYELNTNYDNGDMMLELELNIKDEFLNFILTDNDSGSEVFIVIKTIKNITKVFEMINNFKERINSKNFQKKINKLFEVTDSIYADDGTNQLVKLSPDK